MEQARDGRDDGRPDRHRQGRPGLGRLAPGRFYRRRACISTTQCADLPNNHDVSLQASKKALDLYDQVIREAPDDTSPARLAALGRARTLELRNDLSKAVEQYQKVVKEWPDSPEAAEARQYTEALKDPQAASFYKDLYAFEPTTVTLPPGGTATETFPPGIAPTGPLGGQGSAPPPGKPVLSPDMPIPGVREVVVPGSSTPIKPVVPDTKAPPAKAVMPSVPKTGTTGPAAKPETAKPAAKPETAKPASKAEPVKPAAVKPEPAKPAAAKPEPAAKTGLPADVFTPATKTSK